MHVAVGTEDEFSIKNFEARQVVTACTKLASTKRKRRWKVDDPAVALTAPLGKYHVCENGVSLAFGAADILSKC